MEIQLKTLNSFYPIIYWIQKVHNGFIFLRSLQCVQYKCSSVSEVHGCLYKKFFWLRAQPLVHRLLELFVGPERLASHRLFERPKHTKITGGEVWRVWRMWKTLEGQILDCCNSWTGSMGPSIVMLQQSTCTQDIHIVWTWLQDADDSLGDLHTLHWSQCFPWPCSAPKLPHVHPKRVSITFPADGCVRNFFGFGEEVWRHSLPAFLVSGWW